MSGAAKARRLAMGGFLLVALALSCARPAAATIEYRVSLSHPEQHLFGVSITLPVDGSEVRMAMPAWNALYVIRDFAYRVRDVEGKCANGDRAPLGVRKIDKQTWEISSRKNCQEGDRNAFEIHYSIAWDDPGPFSTQLNERHAFVNLAEILMYVPDRREEETSVQFTDLPEHWRTAAELEAGHEPDSYVARSYDKLVDAPVEAGKFEEFEFDSGGGHFRVIVDADNWKRPVLESALQRITAYELQLMGGVPFDPPSREYTFIFHIGPDGDMGGGGMEHANSTAIATRSMESAVATAAHEFFHVWNVKRIRPRSLEPVDYANEQYTRALWFAEGVTSAYASYTLERTGLWQKSRFYADLAGQISDLQSHSARAWDSAEESSFDAWLEKYEGYNDPDRSISYYNKGQIIGVLLDLAIRDATDNRKSLDDVMRRMNVEYAQQNRPYDDTAGVQAVVEEVAGRSFEDFFRRYVSGTDEIPYEDFLKVAGLGLKVENSRSPYPSVHGGVTYSIFEIPNPTDRQRRIREGLLRGTTN
jgi:predicted metalloprotease with PDZ domain